MAQPNKYIGKLPPSEFKSQHPTAHQLYHSSISAQQIDLTNDNNNENTACAPKLEIINNNNPLQLISKEQSTESNNSSSVELDLRMIQKSYEDVIFNLYFDNPQQVILYEMNNCFNLYSDFRTLFQCPSLIKYYPYYYSHSDADIRINPGLIYFYGSLINNFYPLLLSSNFDSADFLYPLKYILIRDNNHNHNHDRIVAMDGIIRDIICTDDNYNSQQHNMHNNSNNHPYSDYNTLDDILRDINDLKIRFSVSGTFIPKPYYHFEKENNNKSGSGSGSDSDSVFNTQISFNWNLDCIDNNYQYTVYVLNPNNPNDNNNILNPKIIDIYNNNNNDNKCWIKIYPQYTNTCNNNNNNRKRKRNRSNDGDNDDDDDMNIIPKRRKLNNNNNNNNNNNRVVIRNSNNKTVSVTAFKKKKKPQLQRDNNNNKIDVSVSYRGYLVAIFVPRQPDLYSLCCNSDPHCLSSLIRGQIIFYDTIDYNNNDGKPNKDNYKYLIENIINTYKEKGKNIKLFKNMKYEYDKLVKNQKKTNDNVVPPRPKPPQHQP